MGKYVFTKSARKKCYLYVFAETHQKYNCESKSFEDAIFVVLIVHGFSVFQKHIICLQEYN